MEISENNLPFLDILINKDDDKIWMNIYSKPTDSKRYVPFDSNHPKSYLKNIPFCLARRICTIVENTKIKSVKLSELKDVLKKQRYPEKIIDNGIKKACNIPIDVLRSEKKKSETLILPFVSTFNPNNTNVLPIIKNAVQNLQQSRTMKDFYYLTMKGL